MTGLRLLINFGILEYWRSGMEYWLKTEYRLTIRQYSITPALQDRFKLDRLSAVAATGRPKTGSFWNGPRIRRLP